MKTADEKSSAEAVGAAVQRHRGRDRTVPGGGHLDLCQRPRACADRAGAVPAEGCAADEERRELAGGRELRRSIRQRGMGTLSFYRCWTPGPVPLSRLITIALARWRIEEDHQLSKQVAGLDAGQVILWKSWHRWTALCLLAYLYLAVAVTVQRDQDAGSDLDR